MKDMDFKKKLIAMRNSIQDYLDAMDMDEVDNKPEKGEKKPEYAAGDQCGQHLFYRQAALTAAEIAGD